MACVQSSLSFMYTDSNRSFLSPVLEKAVREYDGKIRCSVWIGVGNELLSEQSIAFAQLHYAHLLSQP